MASKRLRGDSWEFVVKRSNLLDKPLTFTFKKESDGDEYCRKLEAYLDRGIVPEQFQPTEKVLIMEDLLKQYLRNATPKPKDVEIINTLHNQIGDANLLSLDAVWVDAWITKMKRENKLAPSTIRAKVGAISRAVDWGVRRKLLILPDHPFRTLPAGYASYSAADVAVVGDNVEDIKRQRRLESGEEKRILQVIEEGTLTRKHGKYMIDEKEAVRVIFLLALETCMRLRELYTIDTSQVNLKTRTIYLDKTKNGDSRSVPLSSVAVELVKPRLEGQHLFPWGAWERTPKGLKITSNYISKLFQGIFKEAGCVDLHFHDLRGEAVSRLYERTKLSDVKISLISGHRNVQVLRSHYARLRPSDLADELW